MRLPYLGHILRHPAKMSRALDRCPIFRPVPPGRGPHGVYNGWKGVANLVPLVLSFFLLYHLGIFILFAYFILLELCCISN